MSLPLLICQMLRRKPKRIRRRFRPIRVERLENRQLLAADSIGVTPIDNAEFMLGNVVVTPVLFESDGRIDASTQDWDIAGGEIDQVIGRITEGANWWSTTLDGLETNHELNFTVDETFAQSPFEIPYEPIEGSSEVFSLWVGDFLQSNGYGVGQAMSVSENLEGAVREFNHDQRIKHDADWSFTIFVVDSSDDFTGLFKAGRFRGAFAFAGGLFIVAPSTRPASTMAHEMGHMFWARDEYSNNIPWDATRGYYDAQNYNAISNDTPGFVQDISIMRGGSALAEAYSTHYSAEASLAQIGWRDSDGDGIFDLADVPLDLQGSGYFDASTSTYRFVGSASAVPLMNQNSSGPQSDMTLNRVRRLEYRLDEGPWLLAAEPNGQVVMIDETVSIAQSFDEIHWRVVDDQVGVTSATISGTSTLPAFSSSSITGVSFLDEDQDGQRGEAEVTLENTSLMLTRADGSPLFGGELDAAGFSAGGLPGGSGATLTAAGSGTNGEVGVQALASDDTTQAFHWWDTAELTWRGGWSDDVKFETVFNEPVGQVTFSASVTDQAGFLRVEAYDAGGQFLHRVTSPEINSGLDSQVTINDPSGRIAKVRAFGHAGTEVLLTQLDFGFRDEVVVLAGGGFQFEDLPDGGYQIELTSENVIHQYDSNPVSIEVVGGASSIVLAAAQRVDSIRYNALNQYDTNGDGSISSRDALVVINDMDRYGSRRLLAGEVEGFKVDTTNDGFVTAVDALVVINQLARQGEAEGMGGASGEQIGGSFAFSMGASFRLELFGDSLQAGGEAGIAPESGSDGKIASFLDHPGTVLGSGASSSELLESTDSDSSDLSEPFLQSFV
ncbi:MAG: dockerin type I domain-containing protein [Rubripirellula sp.]|nr:dockerin type I domain-containing protein [Rubripirellula sp.]